MGQGLFDSIEPSAPKQELPKPEPRPRPRKRRARRKSVPTNYSVLEAIIMSMSVEGTGNKLSLSLNHPEGCECSGCVAQKLLNGR